MRRAPLVLSILFLLLISGGCREEAVSEAKRGLHVAALASPLTLNPLYMRDAASAEVAGLLHPQLLATSPGSLVVEPRIIASWRWDEKTLTYTFRLRDDVFWTDGERLTAQDVAFTFRVICHPDYTGWMYLLLSDIEGAEEYKKKHKTPYADGEISGVRVVAENTLEVKLVQPLAPFLSYLSFSPVPKHILSEVRVADLESHHYSWTAAVNAGPYVLKEWRPDEYLHVTANPGYFLGKPAINEIFYRVIPSQEAQLIELLAGKLDLVPTAVRAEDIPLLEDDKSVAVYQNSRLVYDYIGFNSKKENSPLQNRKVRQALSMLPDREEIVKNLLLGYGEPLYGPLLPLHFPFESGFTAYTPNPAKAKRLLQEAGYPKMELKLIYNSGNLVRENIALLFKEQAANIGVDVKVTLLEWEAFLAAFQAGDYDLVMLGRGMDADPDLSFHWHSQSPGNRLGYANNKVDRLLEEARRLHDREARILRYRDIQKQIVQDAPMIWLYSRQAVHAATKDLLHFRPHPETVFYNVHEWELSGGDGK